MQDIRYCEYIGKTDDCEKLNVLISHLTGEAKDTFRILHVKDPEFDSVISALFCADRTGFTLSKGRAVWHKTDVWWDMQTICHTSPKYRQIYWLIRTWFGQNCHRGTDHFRIKEPYHDGSTNLNRHTLSVRFGFCRYERNLSVPPEPRGSIKRVCWFLSWQITRSRPNRTEKPRSFIKIKANGGEMRCSSCDRNCFL